MEEKDRSEPCMVLADKSDEEEKMKREREAGGGGGQGHTCSWRLFEAATVGKMQRQGRQEWLKADQRNPAAFVRTVNVKQQTIYEEPRPALELLQQVTEVKSGKEAYPYTNAQSY
uniref:Uncharacterized protein n=1 Tax=Oryza rufipogon TaxID=4529 RepID=A0A0E0PT74_ORYRU